MWRERTKEDGENVTGIGKKVIVLGEEKIKIAYEGESNCL